MGFLGDALKDFVFGDGVVEGKVPERPFGDKIRSDDKVLSDLYRLIYFDFGLIPFHNLHVGSRVPVTISRSFSTRILGFEIRGNIHSPRNFMSNGWGNFFHTLAREFPPSKDRVWAFNITRLGEGILTAFACDPDTETHRQSEEYLKILRLVGGSALPPLSRVPALSLEFGEVWTEFGIPDRISVSLDSMYPFRDDHMKDVINLILHNYGRNSSPRIVADYAWNPVDGTLEIVMQDKTLEIITQYMAASVATPEQPPADPEPEDGFPYDFYRGLGLIDDEDMVLVPTFLGPMRIHMSTDGAREHLLAYQPEN